MWHPTCDMNMLKARAECYALIRAFFIEKEILEVETPLLSCSTATDPQLASVTANLRKQLPEQPERYFLHTSPEFPMKRLLANGSGPIYQLCKTFRDGERGRRHNPEFTMLEWYRPGFTLRCLMQEVAELLSVVCDRNQTETISYRDAFLRYAGLDPFSVSDSELASKARLLTGFDGDDMSRDDYLNLILSIKVEPELGLNQPVFLCEYPASQASLARTKTDSYGDTVAERFELYIDGLEIANGYYELTDSEEQRRRFEADNLARRSLDLPEIPLDEHLLSALSNGLPECSGVALGIDRLLMIRERVTSIEEVLAFPIERA